MTRCGKLKAEAGDMVKVVLPVALLLAFIIGSIGYGIAKEVQWWRTSRALERRP
jgi:hypothetical protein